MSVRAAEVLLAELGSDLSRFQDAKHLASWAGMCGATPKVRVNA